MPPCSLNLGGKFDSWTPTKRPEIALGFPKGQRGPPRVGGRRCESPGASRVLNAWRSQWFGAAWGVFSALPRSGFPGLGSSFPSKPSQRALHKLTLCHQGLLGITGDRQAASIGRAGSKVWDESSREGT